MSPRQVATQIWNTFTGLESKGQIYPKNHWTIHGLWPGKSPATSCVLRTSWFKRLHALGN